MSAHVSSNLLNQLEKSEVCRVFYCFFAILFENRTRKVFKIFKHLPYS